MKRVQKVLKDIFKIWLIYVAVCLVLPPLYHKQPVKERKVYEENRDMDGQERVLSIDNNMDALLWRLRLTGRRNFQELAAHENVEVKLYNPITLVKPWKNNYRMHDKYLIADDSAYILGGRNTDDLFLGNYVDSYNEDRDILVYETVPGKGHSFIQLQEYSEKIWDLSCCKEYGKHRVTDGKLREHYREVREKYPDAFQKTDWLKETTAAEWIELCTNPMEAENKRPQLWDRMAEEMKNADNILILLKGCAFVQLIFNVNTVIKGEMFLVTRNIFTHKVSPSTAVRSRYHHSSFV